MSEGEKMNGSTSINEFFMETIRKMDEADTNSAEVTTTLPDGTEVTFEINAIMIKKPVTPQQLTELDEDDDDSPFCECGNEPIEDEEASNTCFGCGKPLT